MIPFAACAPIWLAAGATAGTGRPSRIVTAAMSPIAKTWSWPGMERSGLHEYAARAVERHAEQFRQWRGRIARAPEDGVRQNSFPVRERHAIIVNARDGGAEPHVHAQILEVSLGAGTQVVGKLRQDTRSGFEENHPCCSAYRSGENPFAAYDA